MSGDASRWPRFSVIVVSWKRPSWLKRCLTAIGQLDYPQFEVVVVADRESLGRIDSNGLKTSEAQRPNISEARNQGIALSGGEICAFIDDDAVPEPMWLCHLARAFQLTGATAVSGYVRGRNGISFQSRVASVDAEAETHELVPEGLTPYVPRLPSGHALKLVGTNMAVRRSTLGEIGGFDPLYRFFLDDTDLSIRLARAGKLLAVAPWAEVHHGFAPSERRSSLRAPLDLFDIGHSTAVYLRRYFGGLPDEHWMRLLRREKARLILHLVKGTLEPRDVAKRLVKLRKGWDAGASATIQNPEIRIEEQPFMRKLETFAGHKVLASPLLFRRRSLLRNAASAVHTGHRASVFSFSLTPFRHHVRYMDGGYWLQTGGIFGRSDRDGAVVKWCRFANRLDQEIHRVANARGIHETGERKWWDTARGDAGVN